MQKGIFNGVTVAWSPCTPDEEAEVAALIAAAGLPPETPAYILDLEHGRGRHPPPPPPPATWYDRQPPPAPTAYVPPPEVLRGFNASVKELGWTQEGKKTQ